jgi:hypothetical protein
VALIAVETVVQIEAVVPVAVVAEDVAEVAPDEAAVVVSAADTAEAATNQSLLDCAVVGAPQTRTRKGRDKTSWPFPISMTHIGAGAHRVEVRLLFSHRCTARS